MQQPDINGWIKITSKQDLPTGVGTHEVYSSHKDCIYRKLFGTNAVKALHNKGEITHYRPQRKEKPVNI